MRRDLWLGIELRHFAALDAIARERSFRGAASRLGYVQSAISRQIAFLEELTGVRLIERSQGPRPVHLTAAGELLLQHANDILDSIEAAKSDLERMAGAGTAEVRLGLFAGPPTRILPRALAAFARQRPDTEVTVTETASDAPLFKLLQDGRIDLAFACLPAEEGPFETCELLSVPWVLVVAAGSELARGAEPPTAAELAHLPLIGAKTARVSAPVEAQLRSEAGPLRIVFRSDLAETAQALAAAGVGAALLPRLVVEEGDPRFRIVDLGSLVPPLSLGLVWHRNRRLPAAVEEFRVLACQVCSAKGTQARRRFLRAVRETSQP